MINLYSILSFLKEHTLFFFTFRDDYVNINLDNVENINKDNFQKYYPAYIESEYDLCSIMHFGPNVFAKKVV